MAMPDSNSSGSSGSEGSRITPRGQIVVRFAIFWFVSTPADCHGQFQSFIRWFLEELVRGHNEFLDR